MTFKVEQSGWYRTREGKLAEVVVSGLDSGRAVIGYIADENDSETWDRHGRYLNPYLDSKSDLIKYLGKERPKQKKVVRMAPAFYKLESGRFGMSTWFYESEDRAREAQGDSFVRWLIDTPYAIDVEVPDNG